MRRKSQSAIQAPKHIFPFQIDKVLRESLHMFDTQKKIDEKCNELCCAKKQDNGAYHEPK